MDEKQHANDLEEEVQLIQRHLKTTQSKVAEQVKETQFKLSRIHLSELFSHKKSPISKQQKMFTMHNSPSSLMNSSMHK